MTFDKGYITHTSATEHTAANPPLATRISSRMPPKHRIPKGKLPHPASREVVFRRFLDHRPELMQIPEIQV